MKTGIVSKKTDKNFGFITPDGGEKDIFFHANNLEGVTFADLAEGSKVSYEEDLSSPKGPSATNVKLA
jgi:CspA family cold shock protein